MNPHTLLRSKPRPDQEGIPLNATPCQRPWVVAAQSHERPRDIGLRWFNHATFDDKLFSRSRVGWYENSRNQIRLLWDIASHAVARHYSLHESRGSPASARRPSQGVSARKALVRTANVQGGNMDNTTLLIILIVVIIVLGGGWYGRGRWY